MLKWETMPAVSANRNFYVARANGDILSVVFNYRINKWVSKINHIFQASFSTAIRAKRSFEDIGY